MKAAFFAYSRQGVQTARRAADALPAEDLSIRCFAPEKYCPETGSPRFQSLPRPADALYEESFRWADLLVFTGAMGICVRSIAPFVTDKKSDPAVLCIDEKGQFVISVLSGHIGGANKMAALLAGNMQAQPVITTATDINHRFSVDAWAAEQGFVIDNMQTARRISAAILEHDVCMKSDLPVSNDLPSGVVLRETGELGIYIGYREEEPFSETLRLIPPILHVGIGCRKGTGAQDIARAVHEVLAEYRIDLRAVRTICSIDLKAQEKGLLDFCAEEGLPLVCYTAERLESVEGSGSSSAFVKSVTGVDNVCERAALAEAAHLIIPKTVKNHVTVAAAAQERNIRF